MTKRKPTPQVAVPDELIETVLRGADVYDEQNKLEGRQGYLNASEADGCIRKVYYQNSLDAVEDKAGGYARRGSHIEKYVVERLRLANRPLILGGDEQERAIDDERRLACTPDGFWIWDAGEVIYVEIKSIDPRTNRANLPRGRHVTQVQLGMELVDDQRDAWPELGTGDMVGGVILYVDASNYDDMVAHWVQRRKNALDTFEKRARRALDSKSPDRLPREGKANDECKYCPYIKICGADMVSATAVKGATSASGRGNQGSKLDIQVKTYVAARAAKASAEAEQKDAGEAIKTELQRRKVTELKVGDSTVRLKTSKGRTTTDVKAAEKAGLNLKPYQKTGAPTVSLTVE